MRFSDLTSKGYLTLKEGKASAVGLTPVTIHEEGFSIDAWQPELMEKWNLLNNGILHLANGLADLVEPDGPLSDKEWRLFNGYIFNLITGNDLRLYSHLMSAHGAEAIHASLWKKFATDLTLPACIRVFKDMPTTVLEERGEEIMTWCIHYNYNHDNTPKEVKEEVFRAIGQRSDIYGLNSLPTELAFGILFDEEI